MGHRYEKTQNIMIIVKQIALLHRKLRNIRSDHIHQATNRIVKTKPSKVVRDYNTSINLSRYSSKLQEQLWLSCTMRFMGS